MSFQYLPEDQRARYRRFLTDPSPEDLERFFYLDAVALAEVAKKRGPHNRLGWAVQWGTVRMLGTFLADPGDVPYVAVEYVAEQLGVADPSCIKSYPERLPTQHEHAREIRGLLGTGSSLTPRRRSGRSWPPGRRRPVTRGGSCSTGRCCG